MISSGIGILVSLGMAAVFIFTVQQFTILIEKNEAEENHLWATYYTRLYLGQAVRVSPVAAAPGASQLRRDFDARTHAPAGTTVPFALFERENGINSSEFEATGIFIKGATPNGADEYERSYALIFDLGCNGVSPCNMVPARDDIHFSRISNFSVVRFEEVNTNLKSIVIRLSTRYFNSIRRTLWCYHTDTVSATCEGSFRDVTSDLQITLRNNTLSTNSLTGGAAGREERAHGGIYYYFPFLPRPNL